MEGGQEKLKSWTGGLGKKREVRKGDYGPLPGSERTCGLLFVRQRKLQVKDFFICQLLNKPFTGERTTKAGLQISNNIIKVTSHAFAVIKPNFQ